jgi:hypothetical protein
VDDTVVCRMLGIEAPGAAAAAAAVDAPHAAAVGGVAGGMGHGAAHHRLMELNIGATKAGAAAVAALARRCPNLRSLCLAACDGLRGAFGPAAAATGHPAALEEGGGEQGGLGRSLGCLRELRALNLAHAGVLRDEHLPEILMGGGGGGSSWLRRLNLSHCSGLTGRGVLSALAAAAAAAAERGGHCLVDVNTTGVAGVREAAAREVLLLHGGGGGADGLRSLNRRRDRDRDGPQLAAWNGRLRGGGSRGVAAELGRLEACGAAAVAAAGCTVRRTGHSAVLQPLWHCLSCAIVGAATLCTHCAHHCHASQGCHVVFHAMAAGFCDCALATPNEAGGHCRCEGR